MFGALAYLGRVRRCQPTIAIMRCLVDAWKSFGLPRSSRQPTCGWIVFFGYIHESDYVGGELSSHFFAL